VVKDCARSFCGTDAEEAAAALAAGNCAKATAALERISDDTSTPLLGADKLLAQMGLREACASGSIIPKKAVHARLVRLVGPQLSETAEDIPEARPEDGERPRAAWTASDGTLFVAAMTGRSKPSVVVHQRSPSGEWTIGITKTVSDPDILVSMGGRSATDVWVAASGGHLLHFDGKEWNTAALPSGSAELVCATTNVVFVSASEGMDWAIFRRSKTGWTKEKAPENLRLTQLRCGGPALWGFLSQDEGNDVLALHGSDGTWAVKKPSVAGVAKADFLTLWVSPSGDPFLPGDSTVLRGSNNGTKWAEDDVVVAATSTSMSMWGRSSNDVYAASLSRLLHFDGKTWSSTSYIGRAAALSGTAKEVFVLRADE
jgi:hypothetical protein